jgi:catecholate siderophore receptor
MAGGGNDTMRRVAGATTAGFLLGSLAPIAAHAATDSATPIVNAAAAANELDGVTVITERRREAHKLTAPVMETPKSVTVIPQTLIKDSGLTTLSDVLRNVPGITFASGEGGTSAGDRPLIRGIDSTNDIFVDGIRDSGSGSREVFAIESVEVIKGPGSAYTGRGSTGGSINIITKTPKAEDGLILSGVVGTDQTRRLTLDANHAFNDDVAVRLNLMGHENEVAGRDVVHGERWGAQGSVALGMSGPNRAVASYYHLSTDELPDYGIPYNPVTLKPLEGYDERFYGLTARDYRKTQSDIFQLRLEHTFANGFVLSNATRWGRNSYDQVVTNPDDTRGNVPLGYLFRSSKNRAVETESKANVTDLRGKFSTGALKHTLLAGVEFDREDTHNQGYFVNGPGLAATAGFAPVSGTLVNGTAGCANPARLGAAFGYNCTTLANPNPNDPWIGTVTRSPAYTDTKTDTWALYLFDTIDLSAQWSLNLGIRYDNFRTKATGLTAAVATTAPYIVLSRTPPAQNKSDFVNYQAGIVYKPTDDLSIYGSYATSSNPSGEGAGDFSVVALATQNLEPEENRSMELGAKWAFFNGGLAATAAVFRVEKTNARVTDPFGATALIGETRVDGLELSVAGQISPAWYVFGGLSLLRSKTVDGGFTTGGTPAAPVRIPSPNTGKQLPNAPETSFTMTTSYRVTPALSVGGSAQYMSERFGDAANTRRVDEYWAFDAMAAYSVNARVKLQLNVQNLTDERYALRPFTTHMVQIAPGRTALLSASYSF